MSIAREEGTVDVRPARTPPESGFLALRHVTLSHTVLSVSERSHRVVALSERVLCRMCVDDNEREK
jgi:hypothetical protein